MRNDVCRFHIVLLKIVLAFVAGICVADADEPASDEPPSPTPSDGYHASIDYFYFIRDSSPRPARGIIPPLPSIESENKLLRVIRECKDKAKVFPYELVVHPVLSWDIRFDLTPSTFDVFHQYKEAVLDASYEDLLGCAYMIDELSEKEQAMVLVAIYLFEETRRIFPEDPQRPLNNKNPFIRYKQAPPYEIFAAEQWEKLHQIIESFANNEKTAFPAYAPNNLESKWESEFRTRCSKFLYEEGFSRSQLRLVKDKPSYFAMQEEDFSDSEPNAKLRAERRWEFLKRLEGANSVNWADVCHRGSIHFLYSLMLTTTQPDSLAVALPLIRNDERLERRRSHISPGRFPSIYVVDPSPQFNVFREYLLTQFCAERQGLIDVEFSELYVNKSEEDLTLGKIARDLLNHPHGGKR